MAHSFRCKSLITILISLFFVGCTNSGGDTNQTDETLLSQSVFSEEDQMASFNNSDGILAFDEGNRPMVDHNCPDPNPTTPTPTPEDPDPADPTPTEPTPPPPPVCQEGFEVQGDQCVAICKDSQVFAQGQCYDRERPCEVMNGDGVEHWLANSYGSCQASSCDTGFELKDNQCLPICNDSQVLVDGKCLPLVADCRKDGKKGVKYWKETQYSSCKISKDCKKANGIGIKEFDLATRQYSKCEVVSCKKAFKISKKKNRCVNRCEKDQIFNGKRCLPKVRPCNIAGGSGERKWNGKKKKYGRCLVTACNDGFEQRGNSCRPVRDIAANEGGMCDPLIIDLGSQIDRAQGIQLSSQLDGILFDILGLNALPVPHAKKQISWTTQARYQYVVRPNDQGQVTGINEMFGDNTLGPDGQFSEEGFQALGKFDSDKNGKIDTEDGIYNELYLWHDANGNGVSDPGELTPFIEAGINSIDLNYDPNFFEVDQYGNRTTYKSIVEFFDGRKSLIFDLWFKYMEPEKPKEDPHECPAVSGDSDTGGQSA